MNIVALGGGSFSAPHNSHLLDGYILGLTGAARPRVCFLPTASGDAAGYIEKFYAAYAEQNCEATHLPLFMRQEKDLRSFLLRQHVIYVGGGNTANMLAVWRVHGVEKILKEAYASGIVMCGVSAGSLCWFEAGITDSFGLDLSAMRDGLGWLEGSNCPHYDGEARRRPVYQRCVSEGFLDGLAADDGCGLHFVEGRLLRVVTSLPTAGAYRVEGSSGGCRETALETEFLG